MGLEDLQAKLVDIVRQMDELSESFITIKSSSELREAHIQYHCLQEQSAQVMWRLKQI